MADLGKVTRRAFAVGLGVVPLGLAASREMLGQHVPKSDGAYNAHGPVKDGAAFGEPLVYARGEVEPRVRAFGLGDVTLLDGPLKDAREWNRGYMMRLANDRLLHNFRVTAGMASVAEPLGGWEGPTVELRGHFVGHLMSGLALLYASTGDAEVKAKGDALVAGIAECQARLGASGYVGAYPEEFFERLDRKEGVWVPFYTLHKIMAGLFDMGTVGGNRQAMDVLVKLAGWVDGWTATKTDAHMQEMLKVEFGGMSEVLYNLAGVTGEDRWGRVGDRFQKRSFLGPLAVRRDELKGLHANTHMPQAIAAARRYELSGDERFVQVSEFFFETVSEGRTYVTGGSGNTEHWLVQANHLAAEMKVSGHHQECCCAYNMMKLARKLYGWGGETRYIEYYERSMWNQRMATIEPGTGMTGYFLSLAAGAWKTTCTEDETFWCCTGTGVEEYAKLQDTIYFHDDEALYVNLYAASEVAWKARGVRVRQETSFPESDRTVLTVEATNGAAWTMKLRIPAWTTDENEVRVNGRALEVAGTPGSYLTVKRVWKKGDRVELVMPMRLRMEALPDDRRLVAFVYGPVVLAGQFAKAPMEGYLAHLQGPEMAEAPAVRVPGLVARAGEPGSWIHAVAGERMTFRTVGQAEDVTLKPLYRSWERYAVYWELS